MIVLDDNLDARDVCAPLQRRLRGKVTFLRDLRPGTLIMDEAVPSLLRGCRQPTFVTTNVTDFWRRAPADRRYCLVCVRLPNERQGEIPALLSKLLRLPEFAASRSRMGRVVLVTEGRLEWYEAGRAGLRFLAWRQ